MTREEYIAMIDAALTPFDEHDRAVIINAMWERWDAMEGEGVSVAPGIDLDEMRSRYPRLKAS